MQNILFLIILNLKTWYLLTKIRNNKRYKYFWLIKVFFEILLKIAKYYICSCIYHILAIINLEIVII